MLEKTLFTQLLHFDTNPIRAIRSNAVTYFNRHHYSKPMDFPWYTATRHLKLSPDKSVQIRTSHGILHALACCELVAKVQEHYGVQLQNAYLDAITKVQTFLKLSADELRALLEIAAIAHDSGRRGDGTDHWDPQSAQNCYHYLIVNRVEPRLARLIANTILYKDNPQQFARSATQLYPEAGAPIKNLILLQEIINSVDTLEVMRCRNTFMMEKLPLVRRINALEGQKDPQKQQKVIQLAAGHVRSHRDTIVAQGRATHAATICYQDMPLHDPIDPAKQDFDDGLMAQTYRDKISPLITPEHTSFIPREVDRKKEEVLAHIRAYTSPWKLSIFGHHHEKRAQYVIRCIEKAESIEQMQIILGIQHNILTPLDPISYHSDSDEDPASNHINNAVNYMITNRFTAANQVVNKPIVNQSGFLRAINNATEALKHREMTARPPTSPVP